MASADTRPARPIRETATFPLPAGTYTSIDRKISPYEKGAQRRYKLEALIRDDTSIMDIWRTTRGKSIHFTLCVGLKDMGGSKTYSMDITPHDTAELISVFEVGAAQPLEMDTEAVMRSVHFVLDRPNPRFERESEW